MYIIYENGFKRFQAADLSKILEFWINKNLSNDMKIAERNRRSGEYGTYYVEKNGKLFPFDKLEKYLKIYERNHKKQILPQKKSPYRVPLDKFKNNIELSLRNYRDFIIDKKFKSYDKKDVYILKYNPDLWLQLHNKFIDLISYGAEKNELKYEIIIKSIKNEIIVKVIMT